MRRKGLKLACLAMALVMLLSGCSTAVDDGRAEGEYQTIELTMAVNGTDTQIDARVADYFAALVEERSGGNVTVAVFPNDQLANGNASRGIEMIASGSTDLAAYATCTLAVIDEKLPVATIPWIFEDYDEAVAVIDSTGKDYYAERLAMKGMDLPRQLPQRLPPADQLQARSPHSRGRRAPEDPRPRQRRLHGLLLRPGAPTPPP